jgi:hypothetical protein
MRNLIYRTNILIKNFIQLGNAHNEIIYIYLHVINSVTYELNTVIKNQVYLNNIHNVIHTCTFKYSI